MSGHFIVIYIILAVFFAIWMSHRRDHEFLLRSREFSLSGEFRAGTPTEGLVRISRWEGGGGVAISDYNGEVRGSFGTALIQVEPLKCEPGDCGVRPIPVLHLTRRGQVLLTDINDKTRARLALNDTGEPSLCFYDEAGKVIWSAP